MRVFIESAAGSNIKNVYCERTFILSKSAELAAPYPYPYGFIMDTMSADGGALDCCIVTDRFLAHGTTVECEPVRAIEFHEGDELDHKILARLPDESVSIDEGTVMLVQSFIKRIFERFPDIAVSFGESLDTDGTRALIERSRVHSSATGRDTESTPRE